MASSGATHIYCTSCGARNVATFHYCSACGRFLAEPLSSSESIGHAAFLLNELSSLLLAGVINEETYSNLHRRYEDVLNGLRAPPSTSVSAPSSPALPRAAAAAEPGVSPSEWVAEQAPNLLLYMGAFLVVMAGLITISFVAVFPLTVVFLIAGWYFRRFPRVAQAGNIYLAVGALLMPINFMSVYLLLNGETSSDDLRDVIWLAGSGYSTLFYGALARIGLGRLYTWLTGVALLSTWTAGLLLLNVPAEWAPPLYIILSLGLSATPRLGEANRLRVVFSGPSAFFAHVVTPAALIFSVSIHAFGNHGLVDHWALPISLALATAFYALPPWKPRFVQFASIVLAGGTVLGIAHALGVTEPEVFGVTLAGLGLAYPAAWMVPVLRRWRGGPLLWPVGLGAATLSWFLFLAEYDRRPLLGAIALFTTTLVYLISARANQWKADLAELFQEDSAQSTAAPNTATLAYIGLGLLYGAGLVLTIGYFFLLRSIPALEVVSPEVSETTLALFYFPLSLAIAVSALPARRWAREWEPHLFVIAVGVSLFVMLTGAEEPMRHAAYGGVYAAVAVAVVAWEKRPNYGYLALPYAVAAIVGVLRWLSPPEPLWPLLPIAMAGLLYGVGWAWSRRSESAWGSVARYSGLALAGAAPLIGMGRLVFLHEMDWLILRYLGGGGPGSIDPVQTPLHDATAAAMVALAALLALEAWRRRGINMALASSGVLLMALLMVILRFQPNNIQYVSLPTGLYLWVVAIGFGRLAWRRLSQIHLSLISFLVGSAAVIILGPTFLQALVEGDVYRFLLLGQGLTIFITGVVLHQRLLVAPAAAFVGLGALLQVLEVAKALPSWAVLASVGVLLLLGGTFLLFRQDLWLRWRAALAVWWRA